jgi:hypothetical protein
VKIQSVNYVRLRIGESCRSVLLVFHYIYKLRLYYIIATQHNREISAAPNLREPDSSTSHGRVAGINRVDVLEAVFAGLVMSIAGHRT